MLIGSSKQSVTAAATPLKIAALIYVRFNHAQVLIGGEWFCKELVEKTAMGCLASTRKLCYINV